jgi:hypothetical protein
MLSLATGGGFGFGKFRRDEQGCLVRKFVVEIFVHLIRPAATFLYLNFPLTLSVSNGLGRWDCPAACRRQDSGA